MELADWHTYQVLTKRAHRLCDQCQADGVPFFFKQWGGAQKSKHGRLLDDRTYDDMPPRSARTPPSRSHRMVLVDELTAETLVRSLP